MYEDFDADEYSRKDLAAALYSHPLLNTSGDLDVPSVGEYVWFSQHQQPVLGKVTAVDTSSPRPVTVHIYEPEATAARLHLVKFLPGWNEEDDTPKVVCITIHQVLFKVK